MKKYFVLTGLLLILVTASLLGCATNQISEEKVASLERELQEVNTRVSELELRISSLEGELLVQTAKDARQDAELRLIRGMVAK